MSSVPFFVSGLGKDAEQALLRAVEDLPMRRVEEASANAGGIAVVGLNGDPDAAFRMIGGLATGGSKVAVVAPSKDPELILKALRAGAREFVVAADPAPLRDALRAMLMPAAAAARGEVTVVFPAKGGMGATTIAINVAAALAARGARACIVDLDLQLGDVLSFLDLKAEFAISDALTNLHRLDRDLLDASLPRHRSGVAVLAQGERLDDAERIEPESVGSFVAFLRKHYAHVVLDGIRAFDEMSLAALDACGRIVVVVTQEVPAVRNAQRSFEIFRKLGYSNEKLQLVVNRYQPRSNITCEVIAETVGAPVSATIANDFPALHRTVNRGATLFEDAAGAAVTRDVRSLAERLAGIAPAPQVRSAWQRLVGGIRGAR